MNLYDIKTFLNDFKGKFVDDTLQHKNSCFQQKMEFICRSDEISFQEVIEIINPNKKIRDDIYNSWTNSDTRLDCTFFRLYLRWFLLSKNETWDEILRMSPEINLFEYPFSYTELKSEKDFPKNTVVEAYWFCEEAVKEMENWGVHEEPACHAIFIPKLGWVFLNKYGIQIGSIEEIKSSIKSYCQKNNVWKDHYNIDFVNEAVVIWN